MRSKPLDPTDYICIINTLKRERAASRQEDRDANAFDLSPKILAEHYGVSERNIVRALAHGTDHYERIVRRRLREFSPALADRPDGISEADFDLLMFELEAWLADEGSYRAFFDSAVVARRCPSVVKFRSKTQLRGAYRQWSQECQTHGIALGRNKATRLELGYES